MNLDEPVKDQNTALLHAEKHAGDPVAGQRRAHLLQAVAQPTAKRHSDWPAVLDAHEVEAHGLTVGVVQASQPVPHDLSSALRAVKHDGYLVGAAT
jgi:hypothetical protein